MLFGPMAATYLAVQDRPVLARVRRVGRVAGAEAITRNDPEASYQGDVPLPGFPRFGGCDDNNIRVAFLTFAGGLLAGWGTLYSLS